MAEWILPRKEEQEKMIALYGGDDFPNDMRRNDRIVRDIVFECADRALATAWSKAGVPTHLYSFAFNLGEGKLGKILGDAHAFELPFVWKNYDKVMADLAWHVGQKDYRDMSNIMSCTWASFIRCGAPRCDANPPNCDAVLSDLVDWPEFSEAARNYFSFKFPPTLEAIPSTSIFNVSDEFPGDDRCDFWDSSHLDW